MASFESKTPYTVVYLIIMHNTYSQALTVYYPFVSGAPSKKEAAVLSDASLSALAKEMSPKALVMAMYLNIPTTTLVSLSFVGKLQF